LAEIQKRQTAVKVSVGSILRGQYIKQDGMLPNYVLLDDGSQVSRVNIMGVVVGIGEDSGFQSVFLDDGSGKVSIRAFEQNDSLSSLAIGDCVLIIGRPREFSNEIYVLPEIIKKIKNPKWLEVRKSELEKNKLTNPVEAVKININKKDEPVEKPDNIVEEEFVESSSNNKVINKIKELDSGSGADFDDVIKQLSPESEKVVLSLMKTGDVFEVSPGKLKVLE